MDQKQEAFCRKLITFGKKNFAAKCLALAVLQSISFLGKVVKPRRLAALALTVCMILAVFPFTSYAQETNSDDILVELGDASQLNPEDSSGDISPLAKSTDSLLDVVYLAGDSIVTLPPGETADGEVPDDTNNGTFQHCVKTFARASELVKAGGTILIEGAPYVVTGNEVWDLTNKPGVKIMRFRNNKHYGSPLILVAGGTLTLRNVILDGGMLDGETSDRNKDSMFINVGENGSLIMEQGSVLQNNISKNTDGGGVTLGKKTVMEMKDNAIIKNCVTSGTPNYHGQGGGIYASSPNITLTMSGNSSIANNKSTSAGGGVYFNSGSGSFTMTDNASITGNECALFGGGVDHVWGDFTISGNASITGNKSGGNGGGVFVDCGSNNSFTIKDNAAVTGNESIAPGGGIILNDGKVMLSENAKISDNIMNKGGTPIGSNAFLVTEQSLTIASALTESSEIGVTVQKKTLTPNLIASAVSSYTMAATDFEKFKSDDALYQSIFKSGKVMLDYIHKGDIDGSVTEEGSDATVVGVTVKLMKNGTGGTQIGNDVTTDAQGKFAFAEIPYGSYSLVATVGTRTRTQAVVVDKEEVSQNIEMLSGNKDTKVEVKPNTPSVAADKLEDMFTLEDDKIAGNIGTVEIKLSVEQKEASALPAGDEAKVTAALSSGKQVGIYFDAKLYKTITGTSGDNVSNKPIQPPTGKKIIITVDLPANLFNQAPYSIVCVHNGVASTLAADYNETLQTLTFYADKFSTYAIVCTKSGGTPTPPPVSSPSRPSGGTANIGGIVKADGGGYVDVPASDYTDDLTLHISLLDKKAEKVKTFENTIVGFDFISTYDIDLLRGSEKIITANDLLTVYIPFKGNDEESYSILRRSENGQIILIDGIYKDGFISFKSKEFCTTFAVVTPSTAEKEPQKSEGDVTEVPKTGISVLGKLF